MNAYFKSVLEQDPAAIVICNLSHEVIYMNPAAVRQYAKRGGAAIMGKSIFDCHNKDSVDMIEKIVAWFQESREHNRIYIHHSDRENKDNYMVALRDEEGALIGYYEKHEYRNPETEPLYRFKK